MTPSVHLMKRLILLCIDNLTGIRCHQLHLHSKMEPDWIYSCSQINTKYPEELEPPICKDLGSKMK